MFQLIKNYNPTSLRFIILILSLFLISNCDKKEVLKHFIEAREAIAKAVTVQADVYESKMYNESVNLLLSAQKDILNENNNKNILNNLIRSKEIATSIYQPSLMKLLQDTKEKAHTWFQKAIDANAEEFAKNELNLAKEYLDKAKEHFQNANFIDSYKKYTLAKKAFEDAFTLSKKNTKTINPQSLQILINELRETFPLQKEHEQQLIEIEKNIQKIKQLKKDVMLKNALVVFLSTNEQIESTTKSIQKNISKQKHEEASKHLTEEKIKYQELIEMIPVIEEHQKKSNRSKLILQVKNPHTQKLISLDSDVLDDLQFRELITGILDSLNESQTLVNIAQEQHDLEQYTESYKHSEESTRLTQIVTDISFQLFNRIQEIQKNNFIAPSKEFSNITDFNQWSTYIVKKRKNNKDCLWRISQRMDVYKSGKYWKRIYKANKDLIYNPNLIYPGQKLIIPPLKNDFTQKQAREYRKITK